MSTNLEYRGKIYRERQRKEKVGGRPAKLNEKKNKGYIFSLEKQHEHFVAAVTKCEMRNASGYQCKVKMSGSEKKKCN